MGLDITYHGKLVEAKCDRRDDCEHVHIYVNEDFPGREAPLNQGCYTADDESMSGHFRAGSYGGYSVWRDQLAQIAGYNATPRGNWSVPNEGPFVELVNFSDCEGTIGSIAATKLAADFAAFDDKARASMDEYSYGKYCEWRKAFEVAADGGAVEFH